MGSSQSSPSSSRSRIDMGTPISTPDYEKEQIKRLRLSEDRISDLLEAIQLHILSFLPTKFAIQTSIQLSKQWKPLWTSIPCLSFDIKNDNGLRFFNKVLPLYNVFTREKMEIRNPETMFGYNRRVYYTYHLGYIPVTGEYKILRIVFPISNHGEFPVSLPLRAQTMVLSPCGKSKWKQIMHKGSGLDDLGVPSTCDVYHMVLLREARMFSGDGVVCWFCEEEGLILFDFYEEKFRRVKLPKELVFNGQVFVRDMEPGISFSKRRDLDRLSSSLAMYVLPLMGNAECFVLDNYKENYKDGIWRKKNVEFPQEICELKGGLSVACGEDMLLFIGNQDNGSRVMYSYGDDKSVEELKIGNLPDNKPFDLNGSRTWETIQAHNARFSCLHDSSVAYRSMNDILSHGVNDDDDGDDHVVKIIFPDYDDMRGDGVKWPDYDGDDGDDDDDDDDDDDSDSADILNLQNQQKWQKLNGDVKTLD